MFKSEGATLESAHELALALACFTKASSQFNYITSEFPKWYKIRLQTQTPRSVANKSDKYQLLSLPGLLKKLCELEEVTPETRLKAQIKREGCLKRARFE